MDGMGGPGAGKISEAKHYQWGQRLWSGKLGGQSNRLGADSKGVRGISRNSERAVLGSALRRLYWGDERKMSQRTRQRGQMRRDDERTGLEGSRHGLRYQDGVTEHPDGAGRRAGDGTPSATAGECGCGFYIGE